MGKIRKKKEQIKRNMEFRTEMKISKRETKLGMKFGNFRL